MPRHPVGIRVGAIRDADKHKVNLFGYGTYVGDEETEVNLFGAKYTRPNPKIILDNGQVVWGYQCWWGPEDQIKENIGPRAVEIVPVPSLNEGPVHE